MTRAKKRCDINISPVDLKAALCRVQGVALHAVSFGVLYTSSMLLSNVSEGVALHTSTCGVASRGNISLVRRKAGAARDESAEQRCQRHGRREKRPSEVDSSLGASKEGSQRNAPNFVQAGASSEPHETQDTQIRKLSAGGDSNCRERVGE
ncbi:hypothetical protein C8R44DRAFT_731971 [Mycena epipterygia]|nr:hypothetical protein C8R44DRAFT_731971 [Mycena epipterygia]